ACGGAAAPGAAAADPAAAARDGPGPAPAAGQPRGWREGLLGRGVTLLDLGALLLVGGLVYLYVGRSGHGAGVPVPDLELRLRQWLEAAFWARPRTKEFLFGHPAMVLGLWLLNQDLCRSWSRWARLAVTAGAVGQASLLNSFAHLHTPLALSLARATGGLALGAAAGALVVAAAWAAMRRGAAPPGGAGGPAHPGAGPPGGGGGTAPRAAAPHATAGKEAHRPCREA
ncbi:MAG: DUF5693 family protein, partial [Acetobacteraceae bacterium]|nr:DUF5693 family protein [Acetobacteraceae bacterium]